jgi:hypothetical protein
LTFFPTKYKIEIGKVFEVIRKSEDESEMAVRKRVKV